MPSASGKLDVARAEQLRYIDHINVIARLRTVFHSGKPSLNPQTDDCGHRVDRMSHFIAAFTGGFVVGMVNTSVDA